MHARRLRSFTPDEYLQIEINSQEKSEYIRGEIYAMSGANRRHNIITANLFAAIHLFLKNKPCTVVAANQRVKVKNADFYTYPDIVINCQKAIVDKYHNLENPTIIIEVLLDSTQKYDRSEKFEYYQKLSSLREYILIDQEEKKVEKYILKNDQWIYSIFRENDSLTIESFPDADFFSLPVHQIYEKIE